MPRVRRVEMLDRQADRARIATQMAIGPFSNIRSEGDVRWQAGREVVFSSRRPVPVEARWILTPCGSGTDLQAAFSLDLAPLIGMLAAFVPQQEVANMVGPDLDAPWPRSRGGSSASNSRTTKDEATNDDRRKGRLRLWSFVVRLCVDRLCYHSGEIVAVRHQW